MKRTRWLAVVGLVSVLALAAAACSDAGDSGGASGGSGGGGGSDESVKIAVNPWTGSAVNANIAKIIMQDQLGINVDLVEIDEFAQFPAMASGELDATLEIWPSGHAEDYATYIEGDGSVVDMGALGVIGNIGWFVPTYVVDQHPEIATYEGLNQNASLFATAETGDKGQLLDGDPSFVSYDAEIVKNLGLDFQVVVAGSEPALIEAVDAAYKDQKPILVYWYTPLWANQVYDMTEVQLPAVTPECEDAAANNKGVGYACDYAPDTLYKAAAADLQDRAPTAFAFIQAMNYDNASQEQVAYAIDQEGQTPEAAAQAWVDANQAVWQPWVDAAKSA